MNSFLLEFFQDPAIVHGLFINQTIPNILGAEMLVTCDNKYP